jgi:circadian clock protein KaiB
MTSSNGGHYVLRLYVTGVTRASAQAVERVRSLCEEKLAGRYELEVIDIYQLPALAKGEQIVATPTLVRVLPAPLRRYIGTLSRDKLIFGLDLREKAP